MDSILNIIFFDRIYGIDWIFFSPAAIRPSAEGLFILFVLLILSEILLIGMDSIIKDQIWTGFTGLIAPVKSATLLFFEI